MTTLLHTADWHLGKTFHRFTANPDMQAHLRLERFRAIERLGALAREHQVDAVLVAGDVFHSNDVDDRTLLMGLDAIGRIGLPVIAIPGNHDHGGAASVWERQAFHREQPKRAPNLRLVLGGPEAISIDEHVAVCAQGLSERFQQVAVRDLAAAETAPGVARIGLLHASVGEFSEDNSGRSLNADQAETAGLDALLLGDFHRQQAVSGLPCPCWYAGTHEPDGFPSHHQAGERQGGCLLVRVDGPGKVHFTPLTVPDGMRWVRMITQLHGQAELDQLAEQLRQLAEGRASSVLCACDLTEATLGYDEHQAWHALLAELEPSFASLVVDGAIRLAPTSDELTALTHLPGLAGSAAAVLHDRMEAGEDIARLALSRLHDLAANKEVAQ